MGKQTPDSPRAEQLTSARRRPRAPPALGSRPQRSRPPSPPPSVRPCAPGAARAAPLSESRGPAAPAAVQPSGGRAGSSSLPGPRLRPPHAPPPAPRLPAPRPEPRAPRPAPAPATRGPHGAKGPGCVRSPLSWLVRASPLPTLPPGHLLRPGLLLALLISILTVPGDWAALPGTPGTPARGRAGVRSQRVVRRGGTGQSHPALGVSASLFFLFFFLFASSRI